MSKKFGLMGRKASLLLVASLAAAPVLSFAQAATYDVTDSMLYITGLLAVLATVGAGWVGVSYLKKGWKALRGA